MTEISDFIHETIAQHAKFSTATHYSEAGAKCSRCGNRLHLYTKNTGKTNELLCSACLLFIAPFATADKTKSISIKQKDTLLILTQKKSIILGDVHEDNFVNTEKVKVINSKTLKAEHDKTWRNVLAEYLLFEHAEHSAPALVIFQSKADKSRTFAISYSPDYVTLCGQFEERINIRMLKDAFELIKEIPTKAWQEALMLKEREAFGELSASYEKKLIKHREKHPDLFTLEAEEILPLRGSNAFYFLGWSQKRIAAA